MSTCPEFEHARRVVAYAATSSEVPTERLVALAFAAGKAVLWPRVLASGEMVAAEAARHELVRDAGRVLAPPAEARARTLGDGDLVLAPGVAFTRAGWRLGRGGGHYDRLLAARGITSIGLAFDIQLVDELPLEPHDLPVDLVVTPTGTWRRGR